MKQPINEEFKRMQQLAGIQLNEIKVIPPSDLKIKWLTTDLDEYYEKGLADGFNMVDGKKVKVIIGYYEDELVDRIGYIYSLSKDIESYSEDELDDIFTDNLNENDDDSSPESFDVNQDWNNLEILGTHTDHQGTWVDFADPEDPYLDEEGYSFAIEKRQINQVANGEKIGVEDGSSISHYMTSQDAKNILSKLK
jgi:hypothetical protein